MKTFSLAAARVFSAAQPRVHGQRGRRHVRRGNRIRLELMQGSRSEAMFEQLGGVNAVSAYDPRVSRYTSTVTITPELLARFAPGPATLRLTGFGAQKLLHTPDPRVRELQVTLARLGER